MTEPATRQSWHVDIDGFQVDLPIVPINQELAISLMMVIDLGVTFGEHIGKRLAAKIAHLKPDIIVGPATLGIPVAIEVTRALGLDNYVVLQKSPKLHLADAMVQTLTSITSKGEQKILLDRAAVPLIQGRRVVVVDDVVASGSSLKSSLELVRQAGGDIVGTGVILTEAQEWRETLGKDVKTLFSLAHIPQFQPGPDGKWQPIPGS